MNPLLKNLAIILIILTYSIEISAQQSEVEKLILEAKESTEQGFLIFDNSYFQEAKGICERILSSDEGNPYALYYMLYSEYRLLNIALSKNDIPPFKLYYDSAIEHGNQLKEIKGFESEANVLLAAIYMMNLATNKSEAPALSMKVHDLLGEALKENPNNPRAYIIRGTMFFKTPPMFGGSFDNAINQYKTAIELFENENESDELFPAWGLLESYAWLGQSLIQKQKFEEAKNVYEKALQVVPEFGWIKYQLLPQLEKQLAENN